ncbi:dnaJ homolog subfamily C member 28 [Boleophthalmus pectinirostris]|uniref:dnaJ homolog subfamily C member 28 n=1 Tax=Boleophthalmus pectinirostris TaxID=150288 RepID=UPI000A1C53E3|nr:dnaJ homolog subfamily C member 28 [Boleophthalmus pectinirostris]
MSYASHLLVSHLNIYHGRVLLISPHYLVLFRWLNTGPQISRSLLESYRLLELPDQAQSSPAQVKEAYLRLAKLYHPDSGSPTADPVLFARVEEAYRAVLAYQSKKQRPQKGTEEDEEEKSRGAALPHRHYLSYEGFGFGTPSQRERQYRQIRVDRASEEVLNYRQKEHEKAAAEEGALVERDMRQRSRKIKITQAVERLVEDLIQESMARGDFRNLSGAGKPLNKFEHNPYADPMTHNLNRILIDNGYQPPWVVTQRDIREMSTHVRNRLLEARTRFGDSMTNQEKKAWEELCSSLREDVVKLNKLVDNYNLIVPMIKMQMVHFSLSREIERAEKSAQQLRLEQQKERGQDRERRIEERKRANARNQPQTTKPGLMKWMQSFLK